MWKVEMKIASALMFASIITLSSPIQAGQQLTIEWQPPETRTDGSPFDASNDLAHYNLRCGQAGESGYTDVDRQIAAAKTSFTVDASQFFPAYGEYNCVLTATDNKDRESPPSDEVAISFTRSAPSAPAIDSSNITIQ
jgi:hypothetical protein